MFSVQTTPENLKMKQPPVDRDAIVFWKLRLETVLSPHWNAKQSFSNSSGLKSVFEKLRFRDGLVLTVSLTVDIKLPFQISLGWLVLTGPIKVFICCFVAS